MRLRFLTSFFFLISLVATPAFAGTYTFKQLRGTITVSPGEVITVINLNYGFSADGCGNWICLNRFEDRRLIAGIGEPKVGGTDDGRRACVFSLPANAPKTKIDNPPNAQSFSVTAPSTEGTYDFWVSLSEGGTCSMANWWNDPESYSPAPWEVNEQINWTDKKAVERATIGQVVVSSSAPLPQAPPPNCPAETRYGAIWPEGNTGAGLNPVISNGLTTPPNTSTAVCESGKVVAFEVFRTCSGGTWGTLPEDACKAGAFAAAPTGQAGESPAYMGVWE